MGKRIEKRFTLKVSEAVHKRLHSDKRKLGYENIDDVIRFLYWENARLRQENVRLKNQVKELKKKLEGKSFRNGIDELDRNLKRLWKYVSDS